MFTGIIEHVGTIEALDLKPDGGRITIHAPSLAPSLAISKSIAVNGCCLTVVALGKKQFSADLIRRNHSENFVRCKKWRAEKRFAR